MKIWKNLKFKIAQVDPRDMLNNFCFHLYAQNSLFIGKNCNAFFWQHHHPHLWVHRAGSQLNSWYNFTITIFFYQKHGTHNTCGPTYFSKLRAIFFNTFWPIQIMLAYVGRLPESYFFLSLNFISITQLLYFFFRFFAQTSVEATVTTPRFLLLLT